LNFLTSLLFVLLLTPGIVLPRSLSAMHFNIDLRDGRVVLNASGPIEMGDEIAYRAALELTPVQPHGARVVYLDSPGGSVGAALAMSAVNDDFVVHTFIPAGASCASACASILFISGAYRTMSPTGRFGQHSCSTDGIADDSCNENLARHAIRHRVAYGAVAAFVTQNSPKDMLWFNSEELDCWGISFYPYSIESNFDSERIDPCVSKMVTGELPEGQGVWRVDMKNAGYRAFARPQADSDRMFELGIYCDERMSGQIFLEFYIYGKRDKVASVLTTGRISLQYGDASVAPYTLDQADNGFTRVTFAIPQDLRNELLKSSERIAVFFDVIPSYEEVWSSVETGRSREALIFVANNCINTRSG